MSKMILNAIYSVLTLFPPELYVTIDILTYSKYIRFNKLAIQIFKLNIEKKYPFVPCQCYFDDSNYNFYRIFVFAGEGDTFHENMEISNLE